MSNDEEINKEKGLSDLLKKLSNLSQSSNIISEENIKSLLKEIPAAKGVLSHVVQNAKGVSGDVSKLLQEEVSRYLGRIDTDKVVDYIAKNYDIDVKLSFKKKKASSKKEDES